MRKLLLASALAFALAGPAGAQPVLGPTTNSVPIVVSTNATTQLVAAPTLAAPGGQLQAIYITHFDFMAAGTTNVQFVYGTGTNCGTGQGNITGNYNATAQVGISSGDGSGVIAILPRGTALCVTTSGSSIAVPGLLSYGVF